MFLGPPPSTLVLKISLSMKCTILNRNIPPIPGITGNSANELAEYLEKTGIEVHIITVCGNYQGGGTISSSNYGTVHELKHLYNGKNKILRLFSSLIEGWKMARKASALDHASLISMTDPPLLNFWVSRLAKRKSIPWIYWSMDLYPQAFVAGKLVKESNPFYKYIKRQLQKSPPDALIALGENQAKFLQKDYGDSIRTILLPCGITQSQTTSDTPQWAERDGKIIFGYVGNIGEAHDDKFVKEFIAKIDATKHRFMLVAYGSKSKSVLDYAAGREGVIILNSMPREHLKFIDVHLVTLLPDWDHICVPSKAVSAVCEGAGVYICGSSSNDNWALLKDAAWRVDTDTNFSETIDEFLDNLTMDKVNSIRNEARKVSKKLSELKIQAFKEIEEVVKSLHNAKV